MSVNRGERRNRGALAATDKVSGGGGEIDDEHSSEDMQAVASDIGVDLDHTNATDADSGDDEGDDGDVDENDIGGEVDGAEADDDDEDEDDAEDDDGGGGNGGGRDDEDDEDDDEETERGNGDNVSQTVSLDLDGETMSNAASNSSNAAPGEVASQLPEHVAKAAKTKSAVSARIARREARWNAKFQCMQRFVVEHGHALAPYNLDTEEYPRLGAWVNAQRTAYKYEKLRARGVEPRGNQRISAHQIEQLECIGFQWSAAKDARSWDKKFAQLALHVAEFGTARVDWKLDTPKYPKLGQWVMNQRAAYRNMKLREAGKEVSSSARKISPVQIAKLNLLGMEWTVGRGRNQGKHRRRTSASVRVTTAPLGAAAAANAAAGDPSPVKRPRRLNRQLDGEDTARAQRAAVAAAL